MECKTKLSIIVPVYNVECYIRDCVESVFLQDLDDNEFEVIIVNDGTKDNSIKVIEDLVCQHKNIVLINQENCGLSVARNNGIAISRGEYILFLDSDDLIIERSLKSLLEKAIETQADIVVADYIEKNNAEIVALKNTQSLYNSVNVSFQEKTGKEMFIEYLHPSQCYVWRNLYKTEFLIKNNIKFISGVRYEDIPFTNECFIVAQKCIRSTQLLYIYRRRSGAITSSFDLKLAYENAVIIAKTYELIARYYLPDEMKVKLQNNVFTNFDNFSKRLFHLSKNFKEREDVFNHLRQMAPEMYFKNTKKQKLVSFLFHNYLPAYDIGYYYITMVCSILRPLWHRVSYKLGKLIS